MADPAEPARQFLAANPDVRQVEVIVTDISGAARGKILHREELESAFADGRPLPSSIFSLDITGLDVEETGLLWEVGDRDRLLKAIPHTLTRAPWRTVPSGVLLMFGHERDGSPFHADPRQALARVVDRFRDLGLTPVAAIELEFYVVDRASAQAGCPVPPTAPNGWAHRQHQACLLDDLGDFAPLLDDIYSGAEAMGLPARTLIAEYAPGQLEVVLKHRADALRAADEAVLLKRLIKATAERHGYVATFMAKPYAEHAGSGMHVHASLDDEAGRNVFAGDEECPTGPLAEAIGGLIATMRDSMAIFAPNANSWRRFREGSYAPMGAGWGVDNRTVPLRVTRGRKETRHFEHRVPGADANPYLALAAVLAGMHKGLVDKADPGLPIEGNGYEQIRPDFPRGWGASIEETAVSSVLRDYLGPEFLDVFSKIKRAEAERFDALVSDIDYRWYLRQA
jgi:glutamine synthetase